MKHRERVEPRTLYRKLAEQSAGGVAGMPGLALDVDLDLNGRHGAEAPELRIRINGVLPRTQAVEDLLAHVVARLGQGELRGHAVEFCGNAVRRLPVADRHRLCLAARACGALAAVIAPDRAVADAFLARHPDLHEAARQRIAAQCRALRSDFGASFERDLVFEAREAADRRGRSPAAATRRTSGPAP